MIVLHYTAMQSCNAALERLCDPSAEVSAHYLISEAGDVLQLVDEDLRAWHAGAGQWGDVCDVNSRSVGIELANSGAHPFPEPQMAALEALLSVIMVRWGIPPERTIGHSDMAIGRKRDPGPRFDWKRLAHRGLSIWADSGGDDQGDFYAAAARFGYVMPDGQPDAETLTLEAFRMRFRPGVLGPLTPRDRAIMQDLAARYPVDRTAPNT